MRSRGNGLKIALCMLTIGVTIGYVLAKLMDKLDCHVVWLSSGAKKPQVDDCCCSDDYDDIDDCSDDTNKAEPYTEPMNPDAENNDAMNEEP